MVLPRQRKRVVKCVIGDCAEIDCAEDLAEGSRHISRCASSWPGHDQHRAGGAQGNGLGYRANPKSCQASPLVCANYDEVRASRARMQQNDA
jgi:hypothetical protein